MSDLISRQKALDAIQQRADRVDSVYSAFWEGLIIAQDIVKNIPSAEPERKTKIEMNFATYYDNMGTAVLRIPYSYKCGNCGCQLQRTYNGIDINYCPECGYRLEWE